jgi:hypothetical protein
MEFIRKFFGSFLFFLFLLLVPVIEQILGNDVSDRISTLCGPWKTKVISILWLLALAYSAFNLGSKWHSFGTPAGKLNAFLRRRINLGKKLLKELENSDLQITRTDVAQFVKNKADIFLDIKSRYLRWKEDTILVVKHATKGDFYNALRSEIPLGFRMARLKDDLMNDIKKIEKILPVKTLYLSKNFNLEILTEYEDLKIP